MTTITLDAKHMDVIHRALLRDEEHYRDLAQKYGREQWTEKAEQAAAAKDALLKAWAEASR